MLFPSPSCTTSCACRFRPTVSWIRVIDLMPASRLMRLASHVRRPQGEKGLCVITQAQSQHRARILAKRLRYNIEALCPLLPARTQRWLQQASGVQAGIGASRDLLQAGVLAQRLAVDRGIVAFLRGYAAGRAGVPWASQLPGSV